MTPYKECNRCASTMLRDKWRVSTVQPERICTVHSVTECPTFFRLCLVAKLSAAPASSSLLLPTYSQQYSAPHQTRQHSADIISWSVVCRTVNLCVRKGRYGGKEAPGKRLSMNQRLLWSLKRIKVYYDLWKVMFSPTRKLFHVHYRLQHWWWRHEFPSKRWCQIT